MTMTDTADANATARQCIELAEAGSEMVRVTVNLPEAAAAVPEIKQRMLDAGCTAPGLCGTYSDSGVGVVDVEVSIRRGNGNYWTDTGFSSATEVWNDATRAAGDWTYEFHSGDFPADGSYTVRVRARDDAENRAARTVAALVPST